ncbi:MAG: hypothetical protein J6W50_01680 [Bacteroidaceae bacterium]|nr:hypothetical protein [Bacteroidaceae bacterium]MBP5731404.1 hypothetical protein [Bacteroidaceae bacterium]
MPRRGELQRVNHINALLQERLAGQESKEKDSPPKLGGVPRGGEGVCPIEAYENVQYIDLSSGLVDERGEPIESLLSGFLLSGVCPISKKIWSPTFVMITCGAASLLLGVLIELIDVRRRGLRVGKFFSVFGANPLFLYLLSEGILWPLMLINISSPSKIEGVAASLTGAYDGGQSSMSLWEWLFRGAYVPLFGEQGGDLAFALTNVLFCWLVGYILYRRKIYIRL